MNNLTITEYRKGSVIVLDLRGNIIAAKTDNDKLYNALRALADKEEKKILLNMAGVPFVDSRGLGKLIAGYAAVQKSGGELKLLHLSDRVNELMTATKLLAIFEVYGNEEKAIESFNNFPAKIGFRKIVKEKEPKNKPTSLL